MWKEKLGNYLIDISKYVLTGIVISSLFKDFGENKYLILRNRYYCFCINFNIGIGVDK